MPTGIIINVLAVAIGGLLGMAAGNKMSTDFREKLNMVFGCCAMGMGISLIPEIVNLPAVILSLVVGTMLGLFLQVGDLFYRAASGMQRAVVHLFPGQQRESVEKTQELVTVIVLFCASSSGIYGAIVSGMTGDHSILIAKSVLDLFTAMVFSCSLGLAVSFVAIPQLCIFLLLFFCAGWIYPITTPSMIGDFKALGGFILIATGFRILKIKAFPTADMLPGMLLVMPVSALWEQFVLPLL